MWSAMSFRHSAVVVLAAIALLSGAPGAPAAPVEAPADSAGARPRRGTFDAAGWVMLRSGLVPGWGQAKNGRWFKALVVVGIEGAFFERLRFEQGRIDYYRDRAAALPPGEDAKHAYYMHKVERHQAHRRDFTWWTGLAILLSMGDAYVDAQLRDFDVEIQYEPEPGSEPGSEKGTEAGGSGVMSGLGGTLRLAISRHF
jgi:hypothetical protein